DLNAWMVRQGWALAYRHYSTAYVADEDAAHLAGAGIWRRTFDAPPVGLATGEAAGATQVQSQPQASSDTAPGQCAIKGNVSSKGERIYHVPGGRYYDATVIDTTKVEALAVSKSRQPCPASA